MSIREKIEYEKVKGFIAMQEIYVQRMMRQINQCNELLTLHN